MFTNKVCCSIRKGEREEGKSPGQHCTIAFIGVKIIFFVIDCSRKKENILSQSFCSNQNLWEYFFTLFAVGVCYCGLHLISILKSMDAVQAGLAIPGLGIHSFDYSQTQKPQITRENCHFEVK